jgi:UPF0716 protein FxsA
VIYAAAVPLLLLFLVFIVLPIAELYVIIKVGEAIGILPTLALLLVDGFVGAALARSQGRTAWRRFNEALAASRVPAKEVFDGAAIIFGGALLLSPGFITDVLGILLLLPPTRAMLRKLLAGTARRVGPARTAFFVYDRIPGTPRGPARGPAPGPAPRRPSRSYDVEGTASEVPDDPGRLGSGGSDEPRG